MDVQGKAVLVVGLGKSGLAAVRLATQRGARVAVTDAREATSLGDAAKQAASCGARLALGGHAEADFVGADLIVVSPGVPQIAPLQAALAAGVQTVSEVEFASWYLTHPLIAVTGTNGKSTVVSLIGEMCRVQGYPVFVGGNLGTPLCDAVASLSERSDARVVVEVSSFQLERTETFRPTVAVLLNVTPDHLERYASFEAYAEAKGRIFQAQQPSDHAVIPDDDATSRRLAAHGRAVVESFGPPGGSVRLIDEYIVDARSGLRVPASDLRIVGSHNIDNACAAITAARLAGAGTEAIVSTLRSFRGLPHRMQYVAALDRVRFIDDSKATNVGAAVASIRGLAGADGRIVLIAGGRDKGGSYEPLCDAMLSAGRAVVTIGEASPLISDAFMNTELAVRHAETLPAAVRLAADLAQPGDVVLLAPACSSFDMFASYQERGAAFQQAVRAIVGDA